MFNTKEREARPTDIKGVQNHLPILVCSGKTKRKKIAKKVMVVHDNRQHLTILFEDG